MIPLLLSERASRAWGGRCGYGNQGNRTRCDCVQCRAWQQREAARIAKRGLQNVERRRRRRIVEQAKAAARRLARLLLPPLFVMSTASLSAQEPVRPVPDYVSWGMASANPAIAVIKAFRSEDRVCRFGQLGISGGITTGVGLLAQHYIRSPRPCLGSAGCGGNGLPSLHTAVSALGISRGVHSGLGLTFSLSMTLGTAGGRIDANRHTKTQVAAGLALGGLAELAGQRLLRCRE